MTQPADPIAWLQWGWPDIRLAEYQERIIYSVRDNDDTVVPAGNKLGKDFIAGFILLWFFMSRAPCRIVTTSAKDDHLDVVWGELRRFIETCRYPMIYPCGPLVVNQREIKRIVNGVVEPLTYLKGMVASDDSSASLQGHHIARTGDGIPRTLFLCDEASGVRDVYYSMVDSWADRKLIIGNTWPCENFFKHAIKGAPDGSDPGGDLVSPAGDRYYRKIIRVKAEESPNVQLAIREIAMGMKPSNRIVVPGVKTWEEYCKNRSLWNPHQQCVSLDADFYEGASLKLFPAEWMNRAERIAAGTEPGVAKAPDRRPARAMGVDTAEGGDSSTWTVIDEFGIIHQESIKTPDTSVIPGITLALANRFSCPFDKIVFDAGGGGKEHGDRLRAMGYPVKLVAFGESTTDLKKFSGGMRVLTDRKDEYESRFVYQNRRAEMYGMTRQLIDPSNRGTFGIPQRYVELRRQLAAIPLYYDEEGRLYLPPKRRKQDGSVGRDKVTMEKLVGHSPDEADSLVLAVFGMVARESAYVVS